MDEQEKALNGVQEGIVDPNEESEVAFTDEPKNEGAVKEQSEEENGYFAVLRRKAEKEAQEKASANIAKSLGYDSFDELKEEREKKKAKEREARWEKEAEEAGLPVTLYKQMKEQGEILKEIKESGVGKKKESENDSKASNDLKEFNTTYPDVDINKIIATDKRFQLFSDSKLGHEPLKKIWADFVAIIGETETEALRKAVRRASKGVASSDSRGTVSLTASQRATLDEWNRENPTMKMTAEEFDKR